MLIVKYLKSYSLVTDFTFIFHLLKLLKSVNSDVFLSSSFSFGGLCLKNPNMVISVECQEGEEINAFVSMLHLTVVRLIILKDAENMCWNRVYIKAHCGTLLRSAT